VPRAWNVEKSAATLQQYLPLSKQTVIGVGANAFYYRQVTGDSGSGASLGPNEGTDIGVGPVVTLIHKAEKYNFSIQAKWLPEIDTEQTPQRRLGVGSGRSAVLNLWSGNRGCYRFEPFMFSGRYR
jgi:hypothetical protein